MNPHSRNFLAAIALTVSGLMFAGCTQSPAPTAAAAPEATPAPGTTVIENIHRDGRRPDDRDRGPDVHVDIHAGGKDKPDHP